MDVVTPDIIDKLFQYPVLAGVGYIMWNNFKLMSKMLDVIENLKTTLNEGS